MLTVFIRFADGRISTDANKDAIAAALRDQQAIFWLDMFKPDDNEIALLKDVFAFHPLAIEDTVQHLQRPKVENYGNVGDAAHEGYFYMVIHGPDLSNYKEKVRTKEIDMFVSQRYLVTVHDDPFRTTDELQARCKTDAHLMLDQGIDVLLYNLTDKLVDAYDPIFDHLQEQIDDMEDQALENPQPRLLGGIAQIKRELLNLRRTIGPQREVIAQLTRGEVPFIRESTRIYFRDVLDHLNRAVETIELYRDLVTGARDIYLSSISNNLNRIMKTLTVITVIVLPLNVVTGFFGMNLEIPGLHSHLVFWIAVIVMLGSVTTMLIWFRRSGWL